MSSIRKPDALDKNAANHWLQRHVCYEVEMMREAFRRLAVGAPDQFTRNIHIEAFHLHARNLIEFFKNKDPCDIDPRRFTETGYQPDGNFINASLEAKINQQISHLTAKRTDNPADQLGPNEFAAIAAAIEKQIARFESSLTHTHKALWEAGLRTMRFVPTLYVSESVASATNHITVVKL